VNYHFVSRDEFERRIENGEMLEYTEYCGNYYGTPEKETLEALEAGKNVILEIEVEGAMNVKKKYPEAVLIMLLPPSYAVQESRLRGRGTETDDVIRKRLERAKEEVRFVVNYDYILYNYDGRAEDCVTQIDAIVCAEKHLVKYNETVIEDYFSEQ
jgi:guanylate kinase